MKNSNKLLPAIFIFLNLIIFRGININAQQVTIEKIGNTNKINLYKSGGIISSYPAEFGTENIVKSVPQNTVTDNISAFSWVLKFTAGNKVFKDISFANNLTGYIVTELGGVYKTTNGGDNWVSVMNLGFPYYWYGVQALSQDTVIISGFNDNGDIHTGIARWTFNGGATWTNDIILRIPNGVGWTTRVHFFNANTGIISAEYSGAMHYTTTGGKDSLSWNYVQVNSDLGWFAGNIDAQPNGNVYTTGIHFAHSTNFGLTWTSANSADNVFDGGVDFLDYNNLKGWTGGGSISPTSAGWVHRTTDGGTTWSARLNTFPFPIRAVKFFNDNTGLAIGGNLNSEAGGIYSTTDAGTTWNLDINTAAEMFSLDYRQISPDSLDIWCVGSTGGGTGFTGKLYKSRTGSLTGIVHEGNAIPQHFGLNQNYPNPFNPSTNIKFDIPFVRNAYMRSVQLKIFDILGKEVTTLINQQMQPGSYEVEWNASNYPSGVYFYKLTSGSFTDTKKLILLK